MTQVRRGAEAWAAKGGSVGVLALHGFTGSPASLRPLARLLADQGYAVELPRLPGHGSTRWQDLGEVGWRDWVRAVIAAHERLVARTEQRVVVALSVGACLALYLAQTRGGELAGQVLINPYMQLKRHPLKPLLPVIKHVLPFFPGAINDIAKPGQDEVGYERVAMPAIAQLHELQRIVREDLRLVTLPTLLFTSRVDHVAGAENSRLVLDGISSDDVTHVWLERSYHVATLDHDAPEIERETAAFVKRVTA